MKFIGNDTPMLYFLLIQMFKIWHSQNCRNEVMEINITQYAILLILKGAFLNLLNNYQRAYISCSEQFILYDRWILTILQNMPKDKELPVASLKVLFQMSSSFYTHTQSTDRGGFLNMNALAWSQWRSDSFAGNLYQSVCFMQPLRLGIFSGDMVLRFM